VTRNVSNGSDDLGVF